MKTLRIALGGVVGFLIGTILGSLAALLQFRLLHPVPQNGQVGVMVVRYPVFWILLLLCVFGFAYLFNRIGRNRHASRP